MTIFSWSEVKGHTNVKMAGNITISRNTNFVCDINAMEAQFLTLEVNMMI